MIIQRSWMFQTKQDHQYKQEKPGNGIKDENEGCDSNDDNGNLPSLPSEQSIGDVAAVQLSNRKEVEGGDKKAYPSRIGNGM